MSDGIIKPEDYMEPRCVLCERPSGAEDRVVSVPQQRIAEKLDEYMSRRDYAGAERHLKYWLEEAVNGNDLRGELVVSNEMMGYYRKMEKKDEAFAALDRATELVSCLGFEDSVGGATTYLNAGTVCSAFDMPGRAADYFRLAEKIYVRELEDGDARLGGLYNNMALALAAEKRYGEAFECNSRAIEIMKAVPGGEPDVAITYLNMANAAEAEHGLLKAEKKIEQYLELAADLLDSVTDRNAYYAFVLSKCRPVFDYYGWFAYAEEIGKRSEEIYERA